MAPKTSVSLLLVLTFAVGCASTSSPDTRSTPAGGSAGASTLNAPGPTGSSPASPGTTGTSIPTPGSTSTPTTPADPALVARAELAVLRTADFPPPWALFEQTPKAKSMVIPCFETEVNAPLAKGGSAAGAIMKFGDQPMFVSSVGYSFPDEASAMAFTAAVNTPDVEKCVLATTEKVQQANNLTSTIDDEKGVFEMGREAEIAISHNDASGTLTGAYRVDFYRVGRSVIEVIIEYGAVPDIQKAVDQATEALGKSYDRVNAAA